MNDEFSLSDLIGTAGAAASSAAFDSKSPARETFPQSTRQSFFAASTSSSTSAYSKYSVELMSSRIEHLEKERIELSVLIQQKDEALRTRKLRLESIESQFKLVEQNEADQKRSLEQARNENLKLVAEKELLAAEINKLKEQCRVYADEVKVSQGLWAKVTAATRDATRLEGELGEVKKERNEFAHDNNAIKKEIEQYKAKSVEDNEQIKSLTKAVEESTAMLSHYEKQEVEMNAIEEQMAALEKTNNDLQCQLKDLECLADKEKDRHIEDVNDLLAQIDGLKHNQKEVAVDDDEFANCDLQAIVAELKKKLLASEKNRKALHNKLQELRGNIRVYVRCRPFLAYDKEEGFKEGTFDAGESSAINFLKDGTSVMLSANGRGSGQVFSFDQVFNMKSTQEDVYKEVSELVQSSLDGYKVCIFSYGQTGSGKTHTMSGERTGSARGIIPRAVEQIISQVIVMAEDGWEVTLSVAMVELYNEELRDLLSKESHSSVGKLKISTLNNQVSVAGLSSVEINASNLSIGMRQLEALLDQAARTRTTACTGMNETSSRSHALFMLDILCKHRDGSTVMNGGLRLVDLAGSERLDRTGTLSDSTRLKETVNINKSLSCLADVFLALNNKDKHVPFRNSKLTMMLQDCLSGDGKALMFVNVSPTAASSQESLCSLRFATQVCQVELGKATKNMIVNPALAAKLAPAPKAAVAAAEPAAEPARLVQPLRASNKRSSICLSAAASAPSLKVVHAAVENANPNPSMAAPAFCETASSKRQRLWR